MKLPILSDTNGLCDQCVALCCRYYAFAVDTPKTRRDFDDIRWYMLHEDTIVFVEEGDWYVQVNRKCKALGPDNRCGVYDNRPAICRGYTTKGCDWHGDEYEYEHSRYNRNDWFADVFNVFGPVERNNPDFSIR